MSSNRLEETVEAFLAPGKGILAADETVGTISKRFESLGITFTEESRRITTNRSLAHLASSSWLAALSCRVVWSASSKRH